MPCINLWEKYTKPAIESINTAMVAATKHQIDTRLLLIDNASTDETKVEAGKMVSNVFSHKRNEERWGFQKSVNYGVNDAFERGFDIAFVCNNDIIMHPEAIGRIVEGFLRSFESEGRPLDVGMVTCVDVSGEMNERSIAPQNISQLIALDREGTAVALHPCFSAFAVSKPTWETIGEFDEVFAPAYFEDNDYHYRMQVGGIDAIAYPPAMFYHFASRTTREAAEPGREIVTNKSFEKNRSMYALKWGGQPGNEKFVIPYDDASLSILDTKQSKK